MNIRVVKTVCHIFVIKSFKVGEWQVRNKLKILPEQNAFYKMHSLHLARLHNIPIYYKII